MFGVDVKKVRGDTSYAGTINRDYCKEKGIQPSFVKRGRPFQEKKEKDFVRQELARVRATAMEGSFGTQKEYYDLRRVKSRKKETEILYIFFGIHTANLVHLAKRLIEQELAFAASRSQTYNENGVPRRGLLVKRRKTTQNPGDEARTKRKNDIKRRVGCDCKQGMAPAQLELKTLNDNP